MHKNLSLVHVSIVAVLLTALLGSTGWAETNFIGFTHIFKWVVTEDASDSTSSEEFINLPNADAFAFVPDAGGLINVRFTAESACSETGSTANNWCEVRILIDGSEAEPVNNSSPFSFDSTDLGTESFGSFEAHAMDRHRCVRGSGQGRFVPVQVQWRVTNIDGGGAPLFWADDWSLTIQTAQALNNCAPISANGLPSLN